MVKKEILPILIWLASATVVALFNKGLGGYSIIIPWMWEIFVVLLTSAMAIKRSIFKTKKIYMGIFIDICMIILLMVGYLSNFHTIETFSYSSSHIIISRTLILIIYYLIVRTVEIYKNSTSIVVLTCIVEWISVYLIGILGANKLESIVDNSDNYVKAISGDFYMQVVSYYCIPGACVFLIGNVVTIMIGMGLMSIIIFKKKAYLDKTTFKY